MSDVRSCPPKEMRSSVGRRTVLTGTAFAVPAIIMTATAPAYALSGSNLAVSAPNATVPATGAVTITATVTDSAGAARSGVAVTFQAPSGATLSTTTVTTGSDGRATTSLNLNTPWRKPGSTVTITALADGLSVSAAPIVIGSNLVQTNSSTKALTQTDLVFPSPVTQSSVSDSTGNRLFWGLALLENGQVWGMGFNQYGQLGDGTTSTRSTWAPVGGLTDVVQIAMSVATAFALRADGTVWTWGHGGNGLLGDGTTADRSTPARASSLPGSTTQIAAREYVAYALRSDGTLTTWGLNMYGEFGNGTSGSNSATAVSVLSDDPASAGPLTSVTAVAAGADWGLALLSDGTVRSWGKNANGQLGDGTTTNSARPTRVGGLTSVKSISAGPMAGYAVLSSGTLMAWGENSRGAVGNSTTADQLTPVQVTGLNSGVAQVAGIGNQAASRCSAWALMTDGTLRSWGFNDQGQLGDGTTTTRTAPVTPNRPTGSPATDTIQTAQTRSGTVVLNTA